MLHFSRFHISLLDFADCAPLFRAPLSLISLMMLPLSFSATAADTCLILRLLIIAAATSAVDAMLLTPFAFHMPLFTTLMILLPCLLSYAFDAAAIDYVIASPPYAMPPLRCFSPPPLRAPRYATLPRCRHTLSSCH